MFKLLQYWTILPDQAIYRAQSKWFFWENSLQSLSPFNFWSPINAGSTSSEPTPIFILKLQCDKKQINLDLEPDYKNQALKVRQLNWIKTENNINCKKYYQ